MPSENPLRQIHRVLWDLLEGGTDFCALVKSANRVKSYDESATTDGEGESPHREASINRGQLPEVRIIPIGLFKHSFEDTSNVGLDVTWVVQISTGRRWTNKLLDIQWAVMCCLEGWQTPMKALTHGTTGIFVVDTRIIKSEDVLHNDELNRTQRGWATVWAGLTQLQFLKNDLPNYS